MNPIIIIGLVSVVVAGMYSTYDGLEKQAELAALHADMLARQHAEHSVFVYGEVQDDGTNIIFVNNGPQAAELVQVRAYDSSVEPAPLLNTWQVSYELPPLGRFNLTDASSPLPPPPSALTGTTLKNTLDADTSYRGVTSAGGIFEITYDPSSSITTLDDAFGPVSVVPLDGGGLASYAGAAETYEFYYGDDEYCRQSAHSSTVTKYRAVWDTPFHTGTSYNPIYAQPVGNMWRDGNLYSLSGSSVTPVCVVPLATIPQKPADIVHHNSHSSFEVYVRLIGTSSADTDISLPLSGNFTAPADGRYLLRIDAPVAGWVESAYRPISADLTNGGVIDHTSAAFRAASIAEERISEWTDGAGRPTVLGSTGFRVNGAPAVNVPMSTPPVHGGTDVSNAVISYSTSGTRINSATLTADVDGRWDFSGISSGTATLDLSAGDVVDVVGGIRLQYTPSSLAAAPLDITNARIESGDPVIVVGVLPS
ncbi:MAG: hypothetical protein OXK17_01890 [Thaumarchaeota archaeon]|nr:hypothetical protein [Nitrososphaerota archaeon]